MTDQRQQDGISSLPFGSGESLVRRSGLGKEGVDSAEDLWETQEIGKGPAASTGPDPVPDPGGWLRSLILDSGEGDRETWRLDAGWGCDGGVASGGAGCVREAADRSDLDPDLDLGGWWLSLLLVFGGRGGIVRILKLWSRGGSLATMIEGGELAAGTVADDGGGVDLGWGGNCALVKVEGRGVLGCRILVEVEGRTAGVRGGSRLPDCCGGGGCIRGGGGRVLWLERLERGGEVEDGVGMGLGMIWGLGLGIGPRVKRKRLGTWRVGLGEADGPKAARRRSLKNLSISSWRITRLQVQETGAPALGE